MSEIEEMLSLHIRAHKLPVPKREFRFHPKRRWRFDFAYPDKMIAIEIEGGTWSGGRHTRGTGFERDCEKYNSAAAMGWRVYRFTSNMVSAGEAVAFIADELAK